MSDRDRWKTHFDIRLESKFMSRTFRSSVAAIVAMVGVTAMGVATPARADLVIELSTNGVNWTTVSAASGTSLSYSTRISTVSTSRY